MPGKIYYFRVMNIKLPLNLVIFTTPRGHHGFLDVYNQGAGAIQDIMERKSEIVVNKYKEVKPYTTPSA